MIPVRFPTHDPKGLADARSSRLNPIEGMGQLWIPAGPAMPRPAVVIMEGLSGINPKREIAYARKFAALGYVALIVDSFGTRGVARTNDNLRPLRVTTSMMLADAFAALIYLAQHPAVRPTAISVAGFSYGAMVATLTAYEQIRRHYVYDGLRFSGHMAYYGCSIPRFDDPTTTGAPLLLMVGEHDRNVSIPRTKQIADDLRRGGSRVELLVLDAYHQWDGDRTEPERIWLSLRNCRLRISCDGEMRDERTGLRVSGAASQILFIAANVSLGGYTMLRNEAALRLSDAAAEDFLARVAQNAAADVNSLRIRAAS